MKKALLALTLAAALGGSVPAAFAGEPVKALVLDSGTDFTHPKLEPLGCKNPAEAAGQAKVDDDKNGYVDDLYGWNFVENSNTLVDLTSTPPDYDKIVECMRLLGILQAYGKEALKPEEFKMLVTAYNDKKVWAWVGFTGGWAHGTHCGGILSTDNPNVKLNAVRHIPTGQAPKNIVRDAVVFIKAQRLHANALQRARNATRVMLPNPDDAPPPPMPKLSIEELSQMFSQLAENYKAKCKAEADYLGTFKARVINCSFGTENKSLCENIKRAMVTEWGWTNPTDAEVQEVTNLFVSKALLERDKFLFGQCTDTLFFIAAGNSSEDLDPIVSSPNDVDIPNKIVIAATLDDKKLAEFSCHGTTKVDVAVPGVNIFATYPNGKMGFMSGTSMACPMAAKFGTLVLQEYDKLTPVELKTILMGTVDKKEWLADKVRSGGVVNVKRAVAAAALVKAGKTVDQAIAEARTTVPDTAIRRSRFAGPDLKDKQVRDLYFSGVF